jgi:hypothetical protein
MSGHTVAHRPPGVTLKAHVLNGQVATIARWRIAHRHEALTAALFQGRRRVWISEEAAHHGKRRSLIDDNPASG